jgi:hypothetical protein
MMSLSPVWTQRANPKLIKFFWRQLLVNCVSSNLRPRCRCVTWIAFGPSRARVALPHHAVDDLGSFGSLRGARGGSMTKTHADRILRPSLEISPSSRTHSFGWDPHTRPSREPWPRTMSPRRPRVTAGPASCGDRSQTPSSAPRRRPERGREVTESLPANRVPADPAWWGLEWVVAALQDVRGPSADGLSLGQAEFRYSTLEVRDERNVDEASHGDSCVPLRRLTASFLAPIELDRRVGERSRSAGLRSSHRRDRREDDG